MKDDYLHNRTPRYHYNWKSPYERFHTYLALRDGVIRPNRRPQQAHLKVYGCKAFALTREYYKKKDRLQRFNPKAWIGYLIGYDSTNVYKIWNPIRNEIFRTRDVVFNEKECFNGNLQQMKNDYLYIGLDELANLLIKICSSIDPSPTFDELPESNPEDLSDLDDSIYIGNSGVIDEDIHTPEEDEISLIAENSLTGLDENLSDFDLYAEFKKGQFTGPDQPYPTPPDTPPAALLAAAIQAPEDSEPIEAFHPDPQQKHEVWKAAFNAGQMSQRVDSL